MNTILSYEFMQNAILIGIMASIICGLIGPFIVARRMVFISGGLSHTAFGGLGIAYWLGIHPLIVAIGIIFINLTPGYAPDLMTFLFGNILTVPRTDVYITLLLVLIVASALLFFYKGFVAIALDEEYAMARRFPVASLKMGLMILTALSIITLIQAVGILLVIALLTIPVAIASELSLNFHRIIFLSILCGIVLCLSGLLISYFVELPSGASIILIGGLLLGTVKGAKRALVKRKAP
jgi:zinc transport system permease protein